MALHFTRMRRVEGCEDYASPTAWLGGVSFDERERRQLVWLIQLMDPSLDETAILTGPFSAFENANGVAEVPLEWWDVTDDQGRVVYHFWIACDGAQLLEADTTNIVATASGYAFYGDGWEDGQPGSLAAMLRDAQTEACAKGVPCELRSFAFVAQ